MDKLENVISPNQPPNLNLNKNSHDKFFVFKRFSDLLCKDKKCT